MSGKAGRQAGLGQDSMMLATPWGFSTDEKWPVFGSVNVRAFFSATLVRSRSGMRDQSLLP